MRLPKLDLRLRIAIALATVCIAVVGALGITLHAASEEMEWALVDQLVKEELDFLVDRASRADGYVPAGGPNLESYVAGTSDQRTRRHRSSATCRRASMRSPRTRAQDTWACAKWPARATW